MSCVDEMGCAPNIFMSAVSSHAVGAEDSSDGSDGGDGDQDASQLNGGGEGLGLPVDALSFFAMTVASQERDPVTI